ncbi:MAG: nucleotide exchange factor GrpE [Candidatus Cloacimonetes bacterium]|nr:nucleotide exchange factor GrpE [Candidatus Cloacimonadota bacterium]
MKRFHSYTRIIIILLILGISFSACKKKPNETPNENQQQEEVSTDNKKTSDIPEENLKTPPQSVCKFDSTLIASIIRTEIDSVTALQQKNILTKLKKQGKNLLWALMGWALLLMMAQLFLLYKPSNKINLALAPKDASDIRGIKTKLETVEDILRRQGEDTNTRDIVKVVQEALASCKAAIDKSDLTNSVRELVLFVNNLNKEVEQIKTSAKSGDAQIEQTRKSLEELQTKMNLQFEQLNATTQKVLSKIDSATDTRFLNLRIHFREHYELISLALNVLDSNPGDQKAAMQKFIRDSSKILGLHSLSDTPERLSLAYMALSDILKSYQTELIAPKPGDSFDPQLMEQDKVYGDTKTVMKVIYPGFKLGEHLEKALVDVK